MTQSINFNSKIVFHPLITLVNCILELDNFNPQTVFIPFDPQSIKLMKLFLISLILSAAVHAQECGNPELVRLVDTKKCMEHVVQSGEYAFKIVADICGISSGCQGGVIEQYPSVLNDNEDWCPSNIQIGQKLHVCCDKATSTTLQKPKVEEESVCESYQVQPGDYAYKIINDVCKVDVGCTQDAINVYPTLLNAEKNWCPNHIEIGQTLQVCCVKPSKPIVPDSPCSDYIVQPDDYAFKIINDVCSSSAGCTTDKAEVYPTIRNDDQAWCPHNVRIGEKVQVCCSKPPEVEKSNGCQKYTVQSGDYSYKIINDVCSLTSGCSADAENMYPTILNDNEQWCPSDIKVGQEISVCCAEPTEEGEAPKPKPEEPMIETTCHTYRVKSGDYSYKIINDMCGLTTGCQQDAEDVYPAIINTEDKWCPNDIKVGQILQVCCEKPEDHHCPNVRPVEDGDAMFLTIDDGPADGARMHLLNEIGKTNEKVTFFDSSYQICNNSPICASDSYVTNVKALGETVKRGHMLASHSDNHYYDATSGQCKYLKIKPAVRPSARVGVCGEAPVQNMVQGAYQLESALNSNLLSWDSPAELALKQKAIDDVWTYARLPCSDIWRTRGGIVETSLPGVSDQAEVDLRNAIADDMFSGKTTCRPSRYDGKPWENYGFNAFTEWHGGTILQKGEKCRMIRQMEERMRDEKNPLKKGKHVMLTHDYHFNSESKAAVFKELIEELVRKRYKIETMDKYHAATTVA